MSANTQILIDLNRWEERYRQIIMWGKAHPCPDGLQNSIYLIKGCESKVYYRYNSNSNEIEFYSPSRIINGLLILLTDQILALPPEEQADFHLKNYLKKIRLDKQISLSKQNGLQNVIQAIINNR